MKRERALLTVVEAADRIGISRRRAYLWARRGELPGLAIVNGHYIVRSQALNAWLRGKRGKDTVTEALTSQEER